MERWSPKPILGNSLSKGSEDVAFKETPESATIVKAHAVAWSSGASAGAFAGTFKGGPVSAAIGGALGGAFGSIVGAIKIAAE